MADRDSVTVAVDHLAENFLHKHGSFSGHRQTAIVAAGNLSGIRHQVQVGNGLIHGFVILTHNSFAFFTVGFFDGVFNLRQGFIARQHTADGKETGLHDGVDAAAHAGSFSHLVGIDHVELELLVNNTLLHLARQGVPDLIGTIDGIQQKN